MKKRLASFLIVCAFLFSSQANAAFLWWAWVGYKSPQPSSFEPIGCFTIGVQNLNVSQKAVLTEAIEIVCDVMEDSDFKDGLETMEWRKSCTDQEKVSGDVIKSLLYPLPKKFSIYIRDPAGSATGQAEKSKQRMAIAPDRIRKWNDGDRKHLLTTLSHEITHLASIEFKDRGHNENTCPKMELVSYGIGKKVSEFALR